MTNKKIYLAVALLFFSLVLATLLGLLDFFGFLAGGHTFNLIYLLAAFFTWHLLGLVIFLLDLGNTSRQEQVYIATSTVFGLVFWIFNQNYGTAFLAALFFFFFQVYTEHRLVERANFFVKFSTREVVFPVIRRSFLFLLAILAVIGFFQSRQKAKANELITPSMIRTLSKPAIMLVNKQLGAQLQLQLGDKFSQALGTNERRQIVTFVLREVVESFGEGTTRQLFGLNTESLPLDQTIIYDTGEIDLTPVINAMSGKIAEQINQRLIIYLPFIPLLFAVLVFLFVSPLITLSEIVFLPIIRLIIATLVKTKVITVATASVEKEILKL